MDTSEVTHTLGSTDGERVKHSISSPLFSPDDGAGDGDSLAGIIQVLRRRRAIILACVAIITIVSAVVIFNLTPRYTAESSVLLNTKPNQVLDIQAVMSGLSANESVVRSEVEVLKSSNLAEAVVKKTNLIAVPEFNPRIQKSSFVSMVLEPARWVISSSPRFFGLRPRRRK